MGAITLLSNPAIASTFRSDSTTPGRSLPALRSCAHGSTCPLDLSAKAFPEASPQLYRGGERSRVLPMSSSSRRASTSSCTQQHQVVGQEGRLRRHSAAQGFDDVLFRFRQVRDRESRVREFMDKSRISPATFSHASSILSVGPPSGTRCANSLPMTRKTHRCFGDSLL